MEGSVDLLCIGMRLVSEGLLDLKSYNKHKMLLQRLERESKLLEINIKVMLTRELEFAAGDKVFMKIAPMKGIMRFGKKGKLSSLFIRPF